MTPLPVTQPIERTWTPTSRLRKERNLLTRMLEDGKHVPQTRACIRQTIRDIDILIAWRRYHKNTRARMEKQGGSPVLGTWSPDADES